MQNQYAVCRLCSLSLIQSIVNNPIMLNVIMLNVITLSVDMLNVVMLSVIAPSKLDKTFSLISMLQTSKLECLSPASLLSCV